MTLFERNIQRTITTRHQEIIAIHCCFELHSIKIRDLYRATLTFQFLNRCRPQRRMKGAWLGMSAYQQRAV